MVIDSRSSREDRKIGKANNSRVAARANQPVINSGRPTPTRDWLVELQTLPASAGFFSGLQRAKNPVSRFSMAARIRPRAARSIEDMVKTRLGDLQTAAAEVVASL